MSEIKPALTPEEWARLAVGYDEGDTRLEDGVPLVFYDSGCAAVDVNNPHGAAALLLHGQPFGFTWAMVDAIRDSVETAQEGTGWQVDPQDVLALAAADRIAALLPPREKEG